jgi:inosose dehydratase
MANRSPNNQSEIAKQSRNHKSPDREMRVANAPCSWGVLEFDWAGPAPSFPRVLDEMGATGYSGTELGDWGFLPTNPEALRGELDRRGLALAGAFVPVPLTNSASHQRGAEAAVRAARLLVAVEEHSPFIILADDAERHPERSSHAGHIGPEHGLDERGWDTLAGGADLIARRVEGETGLRTVFHHHCATFVETPAEIDELMRRTDPALVGLCLDTGHATFGGGDPVAIISCWRDRIWHVHLKDCDPEIRARAASDGWDYQQSVKAGVFCELGRGSVDFPAVLMLLRDTGYNGWLVVEQDVLPSMGTPAESAWRNREYLRSLGV